MSGLAIRTSYDVRLHYTWPRAWRSATLVGCVCGLLLGLAFGGYYIFLGGNLHIVLPEQCYRCAQPSVHTLQSLTRKYGIRTVLNLRGRNYGAEWYRAEQACAERLGVHIIDVTLSSIYVPTNASMANLVCILDSCEAPCLMHCYGGADRTGFAAACFLLLKTNANLATARRQLGIRYGHNPLGASRCLACIFDHYAFWLEQEARAHTPATFRHWATSVYHDADITRCYNLPARPSRDRDRQFYECGAAAPLARLSRR